MKQGLLGITQVISQNFLLCYSGIKVFWVTKANKGCEHMGRDKLFKQDQEINSFAYMFVLKRYNKAHVFKCKWWSWVPPSLLVQFGGLNAGKWYSVLSVYQTSPKYLNLIPTVWKPLIPSESLGLFFHHH